MASQLLADLEGEGGHLRIVQVGRQLRLGSSFVFFLDLGMNLAAKNFHVFRRLDAEFNLVALYFDNHDLDTDQGLAKPLVPIYAAMKRMGPEIVFQTAQETPADFDGVIAKGVAMGATAIEFWQDYKGFPLEPDARLRRWAALIEANHTR